MSKFARTQEERELIPCAHTGCMLPAIVRPKTANLCKHHYELKVQLEADEFCRANGLTTREKQLAYIREKLKSSKLLRHVREPGEEG